MAKRTTVLSWAYRGVASTGLLAIALITGTGQQAYSAEIERDVPERAGSRPAVPANLAPPAGNEHIASFRASGVQVYQCTAGAWAFVEPAASMTGGGRRATDHRATGRLTLVHFRGPSWQSIEDGSLVEAKATASAPVAGSIPQLLLQATKTRGDGILGRVTFIQRLATSGGVAPAGTCAEGSTTGVGYRAEYRFFAPAR